MKNYISKWQRFVVLLVALVMIFSLVACNNGGTPSASKSSSASVTAAPTAKPLVTIRMTRVANTQDPTKDRILLELQKRLNITLEIIAIPWDQFPNKQNLMIASKDKLDLIMGSPGSLPTEWANEGLLYSYDELFTMGNYPLSKAVVTSKAYSQLKNSKDGKFYGKALSLPPQNFGAMIRTDWLEKLNMKMPTTIDELYAVIKAFSEKDLDGTKTDGIDMRVGGSTGDYTSLGLFGYIQRAYNINPSEFNFVKLPDGKLTLWNITEGSKKAAMFIRKLLNDGLLNKDFVTLKQESDQGRYATDVATGRLGIGWLSNAALFTTKLKETQPKAKFEFLPPLKGDAEANTGHTGGYWYVHMIPKTSANPTRVMDMLEYGLTPEGRELTFYGIEGTHFTKKTEDATGNRVYTLNKDELAKDWDISKGALRYPLCWAFINYHAEIPYLPIKESANDFDKAFANQKTWVDSSVDLAVTPNFAAQLSKFSIKSPLLGTQDPRAIAKTYGTQMSAYTEGWSKAVFAKTDAEFEANWKTMVTNLLAAGGQAQIDGANLVMAEQK